MKTLLFIILTSFFSCTENNITPENVVVGKWSVIKIEGGFAPTETYKIGEIIWEYKTNDSLIIQTNIILPSNSRIPIRTSVKYTFKKDSIFINKTKYEYQIDKDNLLLFDQLFSDGLRIELKKMK